MQCPGVGLSGPRKTQHKKRWPSPAAAAWVNILQRNSYIPKSFLWYFFLQKINTFCTSIGAFVRLFTHDSRLLYCFLLGRVLWLVQCYYTRHPAIDSSEGLHMMVCVMTVMLTCDVSRSDCVTPPPVPWYELHHSNQMSQLTRLTQQKGWQTL